MGSYQQLQRTGEIIHTPLRSMTVSGLILSVLISLFFSSLFVLLYMYKLPHMHLQQKILGVCVCSFDCNALCIFILLSSLLICSLPYINSVAP